MKPLPDDAAFKPGTVGFDDKDADGRPYDLLGRKDLGKRLTDLVDRIEQPLVIALDGGWGSGKSHFLKLWTGAHFLELGGKAKVIYFDAFECDYLDDPLVSLVGALIEKGPDKPWSAKAIKAVKSAAYPLVRVALRVGAAAVTAGGTELVGSVADAAIGKTGAAADKAIEGFWKAEANRSAAMERFRTALEALTKPTETGGPSQRIVFIIDELDRCRPDYALILLEIVKHFFAVPNVHFVLGTNIKALEVSVAARYGAGVDAIRYLQKFVHLTLQLPKAKSPVGVGTTAAHFFEILADRAKLPNRLREDITLVFAKLTERREVSLRDVQRVIFLAALLPTDFVTHYDGHKVATITAIILKVLAPDLYRDLRSGKLNLSQVEEFLMIPLPIGEQSEHSDRYVWSVWAYLLGPDPSANLPEMIRGAFGRTRPQDRRKLLEWNIAENIEAFTVPSAPS